MHIIVWWIKKSHKSLSWRSRAVLSRSKGANSRRVQWVDVLDCWFTLLLDTFSIERMLFTTAGKSRKKKETRACSRRLKSELPVWKSHPTRGRFPPETVYLDDTHFTQSPSVHLQMIVLMRNSPRSVWQQPPLPHLWSLCFWLRARTQLKTIKARLGQRCVLTTVRGVRTRVGDRGYLITLFCTANQGESLFSVSVNGLY